MTGTRPYVLHVGARPVIVECPHAGLELPRELADSLASTGRERLRDADLAVDRIVARTVEVGASLLVANLSRHVVDLNRAPTDLDRLLTGEDFGRRGPPSGAIWRTGTDGRGLQKRRLDVSQVEARIAAYHQPYHDALAELVRTVGARAPVLVLAVHSMPSTGRVAPGDRLVRRADVVPGTLSGTSASKTLIAIVERHFREEGRSVALDDPYRGAYTTALYGRPADGIHAIQLELNRALYMDEASLEVRDDDLARLAASVRSLVARLAECLERDLR